jgi:4-alpha-glucanotransferase
LAVKYPRSSGILLHVTSLPGPYGVGSFDPPAYRFLDFLAQAGQSLWQILPLGPTGYGDSPYQSFSSYAGNPYLVGLEEAAREGLVDPAMLRDAPAFPADRVDYDLLYSWKLPLLRRAARAFLASADPRRAEFAAFCRQNAHWLDDYALFMAAKEARGCPWNQWESPLRKREPAALRAERQARARAIDEHRFIQWLFFRQWERLRQYAHGKGVRILGDIPIFVALDSVDAWVHPEVFCFDADLQPTVVAGVPPDYFTVEGQLWGNPLYRWKLLRQTDYQWWIDRLAASFRLYDILRIDHFRGFAAYWEVPAQARTAVDGRWVRGPGAHFFRTVQRRLGELPIVAEDLGEITPDVLALRDRFQFPGMKVLQFAFGGGADHPFLPHNHEPNFVVYTGTHDNDTTLGWYGGSSKPEERDHFRRYFDVDGSQPARTLIRAALGSVCRLAVIPMQDWLNLGSEARMNLPGRPSGNWQWRMSTDSPAGLAEAVRHLTELFGRLPEKPPPANEA